MAYVLGSWLDLTKEEIVNSPMEVGDDWTVESTCCSSKRPVFCPHHTHPMGHKCLQFQIQRIHCLLASVDTWMQMVHRHTLSITLYKNPNWKQRGQEESKAEVRTKNIEEKRERLNTRLSRDCWHLVTEVRIFHV